MKREDDLATMESHTGATAHLRGEARVSGCSGEAVLRR